MISEGPLHPNSATRPDLALRVFIWPRAAQCAKVDDDNGATYYSPPMPPRLEYCRPPPGPLSVTVKVPACLPLTWGVKTTLMMQLEEGDSDLPQLLVCENSP